MRNPETEARVQRLLEIIQGAIAVGDPVPTTESLSERLGVSAKVVARYLQKLANRNKITIRFDGRIRFITDHYTGREQPMGVRVQRRRPAPEGVAGAPGVWSDKDLTTLHDGMRAGLTVAQIAKAVGRPIGAVDSKMRSVRQRDAIAAAQPAGVLLAQWSCRRCNTRSTADMAIGCNACWPLRKEEARLRASGERGMAA